MVNSSVCQGEIECVRTRGAIRSPGTIRTYIPKQIPLSAQLVTVPFWREREFRAVLRQFRLRPRNLSRKSALNVCDDARSQRHRLPAS